MVFPKTQYFPLHWENGMKLSAEHFQHLEQSVEDTARDCRALALSAGAGYGLMPMSSFSLRSTAGSNAQSVRLMVESCRAVFPGGYRVEILPENVQKLQIPRQFPAVEFMPRPGILYHVFLVVNNNQRVPAGIPQTHPVRYPYLTPECAVECLPHEKVQAITGIAPNRLKIAEWKDGKIVEGFIPASLTVQGFPLLERWHQFFQGQLEQIVRVAIQVIHEYRMRDTVRAGFCLPIVQHIRSSQGTFRWLIPNQSPMMLAAYYADLAGLVEALLETTDRDFVRNQLREGQINGLRPCIYELFKHKSVSLEGLSPVIMLMKRFGESVLLTLKNLVTYSAPKPKSGDAGKNIMSG